MLTENFPFTLVLDATALAGASLWSLALYLGLSSLSQWVIEQLNSWLIFTERLLYTDPEEFEKTRQGRETFNSIYASICSIVPFLMIGAVCNWSVEISLGRSWAISMGILACMGCGIYELGRRDGQSN
jgi:hypothetical protein